MAIEKIELEGEGSSWDYTLTLDPNGGYIEDVGRSDGLRTTKPYVVKVRFNKPIGTLP